MLVQLNEWGNSLGIRIPKRYRDSLGLHKGTNVEVSMKENRLVITPVSGFQRLQEMAVDIDLEQMVSRITPENRPGDAWDDDVPEGNEVW